MVGSLLPQNKSIGDTQNENHHLLSPSELHPPQVVERNGLLMACAASASRIRSWPVRRSSLRGGALSRTESRTTMTSIAKKFSLILNGVNVCDLSLDEFGKHTIGFTNT